jgi:hypothetical protein
MRKYYLEVFNIYFLHKNYNLRYFVVGNVALKSRCFRGKKYRFPKGGDKYPFSTKI